MTVAHAQPQALVAWTQSTWTNLRTGSNFIAPLGVSGDSMTFLGVDDQTLRPATAYSYDNGVTFSNWQSIDSSGNGGFDGNIAASGGRVYLLWDDVVRTTSYWRRSLNSGATWDILHSHLTRFWQSGFASGLTAVLVDGNTNDQHHEVRALLSTDGGDTWQTNLVDSAYIFVEDNGIGLTQSSVLLVGLQNWTHIDIRRKTIQLERG